VNELKCVTKDPVCGTIVNDTTALRAQRDQKLFYFCCEPCRKTFLTAPTGGKAEECPGIASADRAC
jgi:YHS domain-containing protein